eukprot:765392-Hanusia_phi.AAC.4
MKETSIKCTCMKRRCHKYFGCLREGTKRSDCNPIECRVRIWNVGLLAQHLRFQIVHNQKISVRIVDALHCEFKIELGIAACKSVKQDIAQQLLNDS